MAGKRKHSEIDSHQDVHESRKFQVPGSTPKASKKPRKFGPATHKKQVHASSVNTIKKHIRDISRRLERAEDLPADVRIEDERALAGYRQELGEAEAEKTRQKMIKRYHMVRFFERQKATRAIKKIRKQLLASESADEVEILKSKMHKAEVDLNYTQYCPLSEIYVSLWPQKKDREDGREPSKETERVRPPMWAEVERAMEQGTLDRLRNRTAPRHIPPTKTFELRPSQQRRKPAEAPDLSGLNRRERRSQQRNQVNGNQKHKSSGFAKNESFAASQGIQEEDTDDGDESEGGFFEE
ncbi:hypothetical protein BGZ60DRAFT_493079 [Tricladium varicosporioides]|nr:hypothetical protein BGZ60DRAFT_493079 [Hymenoscyphus varicosporioides]